MSGVGLTSLRNTKRPAQNQNCFRHNSAGSPSIESPDSPPREGGVVFVKIANATSREISKPARRPNFPPTFQTWIRKGPNDKTAATPDSCNQNEMPRPACSHPYPVFKTSVVDSERSISLAIPDIRLPGTPAATPKKSQGKDTAPSATIQRQHYRTTQYLSSPARGIVRSKSVCRRKRNRIIFFLWLTAERELNRDSVAHSVHLVKMYYPYINSDLQIIYIY